jgi:hypothetical protein
MEARSNMTNPTARPVLTVAVLTAALILLTRTATAQQVLELRPNLKALQASDLAVVVDAAGATNLVFGATSWNSGQGPLELIGGAPVPEDPAQQYVYQRVHLTDGGYYDRLAGTFEYHPSHYHFHFEDYAIYMLNPVNVPGAPSGQSYKVSFCIEDTNKVNLRLPGAPKKAVYANCNPYVQGLSVGWGDLYGPTLPGQSIDITGYPDGDYELTVQFDPDNRLLETDDFDNTACQLLHISAAARTVQILGACGTTGGSVSISTIQPGTGTAGSVFDVLITGSGFAPGMSVGFENGSGPVPTASDVTVLTANTITATVSVKPGGPGRDRVWDVRVGPAVLKDGFAVVP